MTELVEENIEYSDLHEFILTIFGGATSRRIMKYLNNGEITTLKMLEGISIYKLSYIDGISDNNAKIIKKNLPSMRLKGIDEIESDYKYLPTGSASLDLMLAYPGGNVGWRTNTIVELVGEPNSAKTLLCMNTAAIVMRTKKLGGWKKKVVYLDTGSGFDINRFRQICDFWRVTDHSLKTNFLYSKVNSPEDLELQVQMAFAEHNDIGLLIIDNIIQKFYERDPGQLNRYQQVNLTISRALKKIRRMYLSSDNMVIITNGVHPTFDKYGSKFEPDGEYIGYHTDIQIRLDRPTSKDKKDVFGRIRQDNIKLVRANIVASNMHPDSTGFFLVGPMGIMDSSMIERYQEIMNVYNDTKMINKSSNNTVLSTRINYYIHNDIESNVNKLYE